MPRRDPGIIMLANLAIAFVVGGCDSSSPPGSPDHPAVTPLRIAAASDLQAVLPILAKRFTEQTKVELTLTFGSSGQLAEQIKAGAPFDVYLAANQRFVRDLVAGGFILPDSIKPYARGSLVLAVHRESGRSIERLADLERADIKKIALANPETAPYGTAGKQALERSGLWEKVAPKIVQSDSVRQALQFVQSGNAEAGLVGRALATLPEIRVVEIEPTLYDPIIQALGVVARSTAKGDAAGKFAGFVVGEEGQSILKNAGFSPVKSQAPPQPAEREAP